MLPIVLVAVLSTLLVGLVLPAGASAASGSPVSALPTAEVEKALSGIPLEDLSASELSKLLATRLSGSPTTGLKQALTEAIEGLAQRGGTVGQLKGSSALVSELESGLNGLLPGGLLGLLTDHTVSEALGSLDARELVGELLKSASESGQPLAPGELLEQLLAAPGSAPGLETLATLLGSSLPSGAPVSVSTVEGLAGQVGTTSQGLAKDFGTNTSQLLPTAMALTAPLTDGKTLGVLGALEGIDVGTLTPELPGGSGGSGGSGGTGSSSGSAGGSGGSGGSAGGSSTPGTTTVVNELSLPGESSPGAGGGAVKALTKVKIVSHRVKGDKVTLVVQVPAAGRLRITGKHLESVSRQADKAERVTVTAVLTKAGAASVRGHARRLRVRLELSFESVSGARSSASTNAVFG
jgi:uncharacterized membrane protein YgcG